MTSGDDAVAAAAERAKTTAARNIPVFEDLPLPADTANLREGANLNDALLALLPLVGVWRGEGEGRGTSGDYRFGQQIVVSHDGGDYLNWEARSWRLSGTGDHVRPAFRAASCIARVGCSRTNSFALSDRYSDRPASPIAASCGIPRRKD